MFHQVSCMFHVSKIRIMPIWATFKFQTPNPSMFQVVSSTSSKFQAKKKFKIGGFQFVNWSDIWSCCPHSRKSTVLLRLATPCCSRRVPSATPTRELQLLDARRYASLPVLEWVVDVLRTNLWLPTTLGQAHGCPVTQAYDNSLRSS